MNKFEKTSYRIAKHVKNFGLLYLAIILGLSLLGVKLGVCFSLMFMLFGMFVMIAILIYGTIIEQKYFKPDKLDEEEFYNLMQKYRHTPITNQEETVKSYEEVKTWLRKNYRRCW